MMVSLCKLPHWNIQLLVCSYQKSIGALRMKWRAIERDRKGERGRECESWTQWNDVAKKMSILTRDQKPESYSNTILLL